MVCGLNGKMAGYLWPKLERTRGKANSGGGTALQGRSSGEEWIDTSKRRV